MGQRVQLFAVVSLLVILSCNCAKLPDANHADPKTGPQESSGEHLSETAPREVNLRPLAVREMNLPEPTNTPVNTRNQVTKDGVISYGPLDQNDEYRLPPYLAGVKENAKLAFFLDIAESIVSHTTSSIDVLELYQDFKEGRIDIMKVVQMAWPFAVVGALGILIVVLCVLCCPLVCCCRSCGNCGARAPFSKARQQKRATTTVWVFLMVVACCFLLFGGVGSYLMATRVYNTGPHMIQTVDKAFDDVLIMKNDVFRNLKQLGEEDFGFTVETMINTVKNTGSVVSEPLVDMVKPDFDQMIQGLNNVDTGSSAMKTHINSVDEASQSLSGQAASLEKELDGIRARMISANSGCSGSFCSLLPAADIIPAPQDLSQTPDLSQQNQALSDLDSTNVKGISNQAEAAFDNIPQIINSKAESTITMVESVLNGVTTQIGSYIQSAKDSVDKILDGNMGPLKQNLLSLSDIISGYESYFDYSGLGMVGLCGLVALAVLVAVFGGYCTTHYRSQVLHRRASSSYASCLTCILGFCLVFVIIFFLLASILYFVSGALSVTCRGLKTPSTIDELAPVNLGDVMYPGKNIELQISDVMSGCENDMALYKVFKLDNLINVKDYMDIDQYIPDTSSLDSQISSSLSNVVIIDGSTKNSLSSLISGGTLDLNPEPFTKDLEDGLNQLDLATPADQLYQVASDDRITDMNLRQLYRQMGDDLTTLNDGLVAAMHISLGNMKTELSATSDTLSSIKTSLDSILTRASSIQTTLTEQGAELMTQGASRFRSRLVDLAKGYVAHVEKALNNEVGQCQPLHDVYEGTTDVICDYFAGALNGIWMSTGIIALSLLVLLIFSLCITKYYRPPSDGRKVGQEELACSNSLVDILTAKSTQRNNNSSAKQTSRQDVVTDMEMVNKISQEKSNKTCHAEDDVKSTKNNQVDAAATYNIKEKPETTEKDNTSTTCMREEKPETIAKETTSATCVDTTRHDNTSVILDENNNIVSVIQENPSDDASTAETVQEPTDVSTDSDNDAIIAKESTSDSNV